jgi:phosphomannomutase/phosphoglucomutase
MTAVLADNIFRGYDIRGRVPDELNPEGAYVLGRAYAAWLWRRRINEVVIIGDNRMHTEALKARFIEGLLTGGINVTDFGLGLVYLMYFGQYWLQIKGGVSVSASHNPKEYNGFKLAVGFSETMVSEEIQSFKQLVKSGKFNQPARRGVLVKKDVFTAYLADLHRKFPERFSCRIFFDGGNATPALFLPKILESFGCQVISQNTVLDGRYPLGTPDPTESAYLNRLAEGVKQNHCDLGVGYDPDGDRLGVVDDRGVKLWNDLLVALFSRDVLEFLPGSPIIFNVLCSKAVTDTISAAGGRPVMWLTGHSFIKAKVKEVRAPFGGELSGHFFFTDNWYGHDDAAYATLRLLAFLKRRRLSLSQAVAELPRYISSPEIKLGLSDRIKFAFIDRVLAPALKALLPKAKAVTLDGIRLDTAEQMAVVRASQNGPYLTVKFEAKTPVQYVDFKQKLKQLLKAHREIDWSNSVNAEALG